MPRVKSENAGNIWTVARIDKSLWIQDIRSDKMPLSMRGVFIYAKFKYLGKRTGIQETRALTIAQVERLISRLQQAVDEAKEIECLPPQYHSRIGE